ncbi:exported hypothetical protein [Verrucomicrobia bacterium]|nr:exported hypothetical protein [Verrucomicrobiota bacterium]
MANPEQPNKKEKTLKKTLSIIALAAASVAAFAQGKVGLQNDGGSLYTLSVIPGYYLAPDSAWAGKPIPITGPLPSGVVLEVGLYGGTASTVLTLQTEILLNPVGGGGGGSAGRPPFTGVHIDSTPNYNGDGSLGMPGYVVGGTAYFQVAVWDRDYASPQLAIALQSYAGYNHIFSMTPGDSLPYPGVINGGGSTWAAAGDESPLFVSVSPEPSMFALGGLGAVGFWILHRRKS